MTPQGSRLDVAVIGAGAIGGYYGGRLARAGHRVHFMARSSAEALREHGLTVLSSSGDFRVDRPLVYASAADLPPCDLVLVATKATGNDAVLPALGSAVRPGTALVAMQNGLGAEERLAACYPQAAVFAGLCFICSFRDARPWIIHHVAYGLASLAPLTAVAPPETIPAQTLQEAAPSTQTAPLEAVAPATAGAPSDLQPDSGPGAPLDREGRPTPGRAPGLTVLELAAIFREAGIETEVLGAALEARWRKLVWNIPFNGLSVVLDATTGDLSGSPAARAAILALMQEVIGAAAAGGIAIEPDFAVKMLGTTDSMAAYNPSMRLDCLARRPMEIEAIYWNPIRWAAARGREMPGCALLARQLEHRQSLYRP
ncbi:MAG: hypothetical protein LBS27_05960 [Bifidobacteriaceae bacterium]|jgi:2-dehydropantoate 2-reductase|nr:hypothetical protein [Bifidobacteriaceae bacterium]